MALLFAAGAVSASAQGCCAQKGEAEMACCKGGQAVIENIMTRTSVRKYTDRKIEAEKVETLLRAAMAAPTAVNKQPWHFIVVDDPAVLDSLAGRGQRGNMLRSAPLAIVVCGDFSKALDGVNREYWIQDTSAATENLLLAAHGLGLGAVWTGAWPNEQRCDNIRRVLDLPENIVPLNITIIGYPAENPAPKDKWKPENVSYNKFGGKRN